MGDGTEPGEPGGPPPAPPPVDSPAPLPPGERTLAAFWTCPFGTFESLFRFVYDRDGTVLESLPPEQQKLLRWKQTTTTSTLVKNMINAIGFRHTNKPTWIGTWGMHQKMAAFQNILPHQKINHFPGSFAIGRKDSLWRSVSRMQNIHGKKVRGVGAAAPCRSGCPPR